jgi:hypothetical protein
MISKIQRRILIVYSEGADIKDGEYYYTLSNRPSYDTVSRKLKIKEYRLKTEIEKLIDMGLLEEFLGTNKKGICAIDDYPKEALRKFFNDTGLSTVSRTDFIRYGIS